MSRRAARCSRARLGQPVAVADMAEGIDDVLDELGDVGPARRLLQ
jgi:hypothetical protein